MLIIFLEIRKRLTNIVIEKFLQSQKILNIKSPDSKMHMFVFCFNIYFTYKYYQIQYNMQ